MHVVTGATNNHNFNKDPNTQLAKNQVSKIEIIVENNDRIININGKQVSKVTIGDRKKLYNAKLYLSDPWHTPSNAIVRNLKFKNLPTIIKKLPRLVFFNNLNKHVKNMDYSIIVDKSGSMRGKNWKDARAAVKLLAPVVTKQDSNGITLYFFSSDFKTYNNVKSSSKVMKLFDKN